MKGTVPLLGGSLTSRNVEGTHRFCRKKDELRFGGVRDKKMFYSSIGVVDFVGTFIRCGGMATRRASLLVGRQEHKRSRRASQRGQDDDS